MLKQSYGQWSTGKASKLWFYKLSFFMCFTLYNVLNVNKSVLGGGDPHFMIRIKGMTHPLCFDFPANPGDVLRLLSDTKSGSCLICFNC